MIVVLAKPLDSVHKPVIVDGCPMSQMRRLP